MSADIAESGVAAGMLNSFVERIEAIEAEIAERNADKSDVFKEAKGNGIDVAALREVIGTRRKLAKDPQKHAERQAIVDLYTATLEKFSSLVRAREAA